MKKLWMTCALALMLAFVLSAASLAPTATMTSKLVCTVRDENSWPGLVYFRFQVISNDELMPVTWLVPKEQAPSGWRVGTIVGLTLQGQGSVSAQSEPEPKR